MSHVTDHTPDPTTHGLMFVLFDPNDADRESWREDFGGDAAQAWAAFTAKYPPESGVRVVRTESGPVHRSPVYGLLDYWRRIGDVLAADPLVYSVPGVSTTFVAVACDGTELGDDFATYADAQRAVVEWAARERERVAG